MVLISYVILLCKVLNLVSSKSKNGGRFTLIIVPTGMMDDIVRSYWKNEVLVEITAFVEGVMIFDRISLAT